MCFKINSFYCPKPFKLTKQLVCYKHMDTYNGQLQAPFRTRTKYYLGKKKRARETDNSFLKSFDLFAWESTVHAGIHSYRGKEIAFKKIQGPNMVVVECVIPRGTEVMFNVNEIVSTAIIPKRRIKQ